MQEPLLNVNVPVLPDGGEDSFVLHADEKDAFLCVADGCGGLGSRRYPLLGNQTGAAIASRLAVRCFERWAQERKPMPCIPEEGEALMTELQSDLNDLFRGFAQKHCAEDGSRITGSMQRRLPTTLCAALMETGAAGWRECSFVWAGDSRAYMLDENGLHQCTQDHLRAETDPFETLYHDVPLAQYLSADRPVRLSMRRMRALLPCVILTVTDGAYSALASPMEFEMLLLDALKKAGSWTGWQKKLTSALKRLAQDDAVILLAPCGWKDFDDCRQRLSLRRETLKKQFVTPCRRRRGDVAFAREKWQEYRKNYDWTGGTHERMDWRI